MTEVALLTREPAVPLRRFGLPPACPLCGAPQNPRVMVAHIQALVSAYYGLAPRKMTEADRTHAVVRPRQIAMYLAHELTPKSLVDIGQRFGGKDHTTVIHAIKVIQSLMLTDVELESDVAALRARLAG